MLWRCKAMAELSLRSTIWARSSVTVTSTAAVFSDSFLTASQDSTFTPAVITQGDPPSQLFVQQDGKILVWGCATEIRSASAAGLIRLNPDGTVDKTFQLALKPRYSNVDICMSGVLPLPDGRLYVFGSILGGDLFRVLSHGSVDTAFSREISPTPRGVTVPTGTEVIADGRFLRLGTDSALQTAFDSTPTGSPIAVTQGGAFLAFSESKISRIQPSGTNDPSFHTISVEVSAQVGSILPQEDGKLLITGDFSFVSGVPRPGVARLHSNGALDSTFTPTDGIPRFGDWWVPVLGLIRSQPGASQFVVAGLPQANEDSGLVPGSILARLNADGSRDRNFSPSWLSTNNHFGEVPPGDLAVQADGKIILVTASFNGPTQLIRLLPDGSEDQTFQPELPFAPRKIVLLPDGRLLVASDTFGNNANNSDEAFSPPLVRLHSDGTLDPAFSPSVPAPSWMFNPYSVHLALEPDGKIILGLLPRILRFQADGTWDPSFGVGSNPPGAEVNNDSDGYGLSMIVAGNQILVLGKISRVNGQFLKNGPERAAGRVARPRWSL